MICTLVPSAYRSSRRLLGGSPKPFRRLGDRLVEQLSIDPVRRDDHQPPFELVPVPRDEVVHVVGPPQALERRLDEAFAHPSWPPSPSIITNWRSGMSTRAKSSAEGR
jgi:hypothetical protein